MPDFGTLIIKIPGIAGQTPISDTGCSEQDQFDLMLSLDRPIDVTTRLACPVSDLALFGGGALLALLVEVGNDEKDRSQHDE